MNCQYCGNEMGNREICPYCGHASYRKVSVQKDYIGNGYQGETIPIRMQEGRDARDIKRYLKNIETWGLMSVILLGGIFVIEILRMILMLA